MSSENNTASAVVQWAQNNPVLADRGIDQAIWNALKASIFPGAKDDSIIMAWDYCAARKMDILMKPVHLVPMFVTDKQTGEKGMRDVVMPGIGMYRIQADRSGDYAGADAPIFGNDITLNLDGVSITVPEFCTFTVYKLVKNQRVAYSATEYWEENYATAGRDTLKPNTMWLKRKRGQLVKCAEAQALRRAWPEIGQDATAEEMEGKSYEMKTINPIGVESSGEDSGESGLKDFPEKIFNQRVEGWAEGIKNGDISVDQIETFAENKGYALTKDQRNKLENPTPIDGDTNETA